MPEIRKPRPTGRYFVYLIQLSSPLGGDKHQAKFYLGIAKNWKHRFCQHFLGNGARMLAYAAAKGIKFLVVGLWQVQSYHAARIFERWAKQSNKKHERLLYLSKSQIQARIARKFKVVLEIQ